MQAQPHQCMASQGHARDQAAPHAVETMKVCSSKGIRNSLLQVFQAQLLAGESGAGHCSSATNFRSCTPRIDTFQGQLEAKECAPEVPFLIKEGLVGWSDPSKFELENLKREYGDCSFECGTNSDGDAELLTLDEYCEYMSSTADEDPMYLFDATFEEADEALLRAYARPSCCTEDLLSLLELPGEPDSRPPHRWLLIGPPRSGSPLHVDPLHSAAWNSLIEGWKWWVLFPPGTPEAGLCMEEDAKAHLAGTGTEGRLPAYRWFRDKLPLLKGFMSEACGHSAACRDQFTPLPGQHAPEAEGQHPSMWRFRYPEQGSFAAEHCMLEFMQGPGQTVVVPHGWWHAVLNCTVTVAVTENFVTSSSVAASLLELSAVDAEMACRWKTALQQATPAQQQAARGLLESTP